MNSKEILLELMYPKTIWTSRHPTGKTWRVVHDEAGRKQLRRELRKLKPALIVMEASGGWRAPWQ